MSASPTVRAASAIGKPKEVLLTPSLLLNLNAVNRNIALVAARLHGKAALRPHTKSHKCAEIARLQVAAGSLIGFTTATIWEALALRDAGLDSLPFLIANYAPLTVNLNEVYYVVQNGIVVDVWPILARGNGRKEHD